MMTSTLSPTEKRAWLAVWSMCPVYAIYFAIQLLAPDLFPTFLGRIACLAVVASVHALTYVTGLLWIKRQERGDGLLADERDKGIDARATRTAYFVMLTGMILVGVVMPFSDHGWNIANAALFFIVLAEAWRYALIVLGYRGASRLAH